LSLQIGVHRSNLAALGGRLCLALVLVQAILVVLVFELPVGLQDPLDTVPAQMVRILRPKLQT
jgi:hypothetical protein